MGQSGVTVSLVSHPDSRMTLGELEEFIESARLHLYADATSYVRIEHEYPQDVEGVSYTLIVDSG